MRIIQGIAVFIFLCGGCLAAETPDKSMLQGIAEAYLAKRPATAPPAGLSYENALATQGEYVQILGPSLGKRVGYKVGLVTAGGQERNKISHPIRGVLFEKMLLRNNSTVPVAYGTRPIVEPDLMVRVRDDGINNASTIEEAAEHLSEIICFIELADGTFRTNAPVDAGVLVASNVGARAGIMGEARKVEVTREFLSGFKGMSLVLADKSGKEVSRVTADGVMGHPINAVLWLVKDLKRTGEKLKAGDVVSLGSPSPQVSPQAGDEFVLRYEGLPGGPITAKVRFGSDAK